MEFRKLFDREWYYRKFLRIAKSFFPADKLQALQLRHKIRLVYEDTFHASLHIWHPRTLNEKLIWLSLYWKNPLVVQCADKFKMREYVANCGLEHLVVPLLGVWENPDDIDFDALPNRYVLKCNHGCGYNIILKDKSKLDVDSVKKQLRIWLKTNYRGG